MFPLIKPTMYDLLFSQLIHGILIYSVFIDDWFVPKVYDFLTNKFYFSYLVLARKVKSCALSSGRNYKIIIIIKVN